MRLKHQQSPDGRATIIADATVLMPLYLEISTAIVDEKMADVGLVIPSPSRPLHVAQSRLNPRPGGQSIRKVYDQLNNKQMMNGKSNKDTQCNATINPKKRHIVFNKIIYY